MQAREIGNALRKILSLGATDMMLYDAGVLDLGLGGENGMLSKGIKLPWRGKEISAADGSWFRCNVITESSLGQKQNCQKRRLPLCPSLSLSFAFNLIKSCFSGDPQFDAIIDFEVPSVDGI